MKDSWTFVSDHGPRVVYGDMPAADLKRYKETIPDVLVDDWEEYGLSQFKDGFFWFTNPAQYADVISAFLPGQELNVVMRTGLGGLLYQDPKADQNTGPGELNTYNYLCPHYRSVRGMGHDLTMIITCWLTTDEMWRDMMLYGLYEEAREELSPPGHDEMYGFAPALALGGEMTASALKMQKLEPHLAMLAQLK